MVYICIENLEKIFEEANRNFLKRNISLFKMKVSERTLCGALMIELYEVLKNTEYSAYFVDVEYNRNVGGKVKTLKKTINGLHEEVVTINCDLIVHSRGEYLSDDNLIALEMKKSTAKKVDKYNDRLRLECLTKDPTNDVWSYGGGAFPENVCGYKLGIYYEINFNKNFILIEYYGNGKCYKSYNLPIYYLELKQI